MQCGSRCAILFRYERAMQAPPLGVDGGAVAKV